MACTVTTEDIRDEIHKSLILKDALQSNENGYWYPFSLDNRTLPKDISMILAQQEALYGRGKYGNIFSTETNEFGVQINVNPPQALADAMTKQNFEDDARNREQYEKDNFLYDDLLFETEDSSPSSLPFVNFNFYINAKTSLKNKLERRISDLKALRRFRNDKELRNEVARITTIRDNIEKEINDLINSPNIFEMTLAMFNDDINLINYLLDNPDSSVEDIHAAEHLISLFDIISDYSPDNTLNEFVDVSQYEKLGEDVREPLDRLRGEVTEMKAKLFTAKKAYLLDLVEHSDKLNNIFPTLENEQIMEKLLSDKDDINLMSLLFGTVDKNFSREDSLLAQLVRQELENKRSKNKSYSAELILKLNRVVPKVKRKLLSMGYGISIKPFNTVLGELSYDLFYQKTDQGNKTGKLISKFSNKWYRTQAQFFKKHNEDYKTAIAIQDWSALSKSLEDKYNWLNENTEFINVNLLPEITDDPEFRNFSGHFKGSVQQREQYKQELISKLGKYHYDKVVEEQKEHIRDYVAMGRQEIQTLLDSHGLQKTSELPQDVQDSLNITLLRNSPFDFATSHFAGHKGRVEYTIGTQTWVYNSQLKYNSFIPKREATRVDYETNTTFSQDTGYFDADFDKIEQDADLMEFWEITNEMATFMNMTLSDGAMNLTHNSLPYLQKMTTDILLDKNMGPLTKITTLLQSTKDTIFQLMTANTRRPSPKDVENINKAGIRNVQSEVSLIFKTELLKLKNLAAREIGKGTTLDLEKETPAIIDYLLDLTQSKNKAELESKIGKKPKVSDVLYEYITDKVMNEMTFNLPVMMRAYMDMVSEYKSQKDSQPKISIYKDLYESIQMKKKDRRETPLSRVSGYIMRKAREKGIQDKRLHANQRMNSWYNKNIMNLEEAEHWANISDVTGHKYHNKQEKEFKEAAEQEIVRLKERLANESDPEIIKNIEYELLELQDTLENIGRDYTLAAMYNTVINRFKVFLGLAWSLPASVTNRFQGWYTGVINDTGKFWTAGNFYVANSFINKKGLRYVPGQSQYKNEIKKTKLFIEKLDIIQDATNEIDKARNASGLTGWAKKASPFYLTEYVEWHNQTPQILSMLMDETIKDKDGNEVKIFDGKTFPAHRINDAGELVLKDKFATEDNLATWEHFSNDASADKKAKYSDTIAIMNGDYSRTGSLHIKNNVFGKTLMTFKTWLPNQIWNRFATNQTNLALDKENFNGIYTGAFLNKKTNAATTLLGTTGAMAAGVMTLGPALGTAISAGMLAYSYYYNRKNNLDGEDLQIAAQLAETGKALLKKFVGLPVNTITGKDIVKAHEFNKLNLTEEEKQNLHAIVTEITTLLTLALAKLLLKSMFGDNDEEEPKTFAGKGTVNPYIDSNRRSEQEKQIYNLLENQLTKTIGEVSLYINPSEMYKSMSSTGLGSWFDRIQALSNAYNKYQEGLDEIQTGPNAGESRMMNELQKTFIPSIGQGNFGFERMMETEWNKNETVDSWFYSDYKKDKKKARQVRTGARQELMDYWKEEFDYDNQTPAMQRVLDTRIDKLVKERLEVVAPYPLRYMYNEEQERVE